MCGVWRVWSEKLYVPTSLLPQPSQSQPMLGLARLGGDPLQSKRKTGRLQQALTVYKPFPHIIQSARGKDGKKER